MSDAHLTGSISWNNPLADTESITLAEYLDFYSNRIVQESEKLFVREFLFPLFGEKKIKYVIPQYPFIDSEGKNRRIDFGIVYEQQKIALEVNGETYHAEGVIPNENFDDNLNRQNEILNAGWSLLRFSYNQLLSDLWRKRVRDALFKIVQKKTPSLISQTSIIPNYLQQEALAALNYYRSVGWKKGIVVLPTGTGKTYLSAFDSLNAQGRILFIVHRLDILTQSKESFERIYTGKNLGLLTGEVKEYIHDSKVLFASKDSLRNPDNLQLFNQTEFDYIIIDEVHHGQAPSYKIILDYFSPNVFLLGLTATPDRMDRKDIFEIFNYQKVFEFSLNEAIEEGFLVPYTYYGLKDNIDYSNIRYNGNKYNVTDLDDTLIIKERNEQILKEYISKGGVNKALGFCCSIKHADAMAKFFTDNGVPAISITSNTENRDVEIEKFKQNEYPIAFTVDLFNEGIDFPDINVLMFLRPTESKTVFMQQLGRGLRLCGSKSNVIIIDFIGNYKKANKIRQYLSKKGKPKTNPKNGRTEKVIYEYTPGCKVYFDSEVEEILDNQDFSDRQITKEDLIGAYYDLAEILNKKPTQDELNNLGEFKISKYFSIFGSWTTFLKEIGEHTEASYHFPQGTHLGHILYIVKTVGSNNTAYSHLKDKYICFTGNYSSEFGTFQRQTKYKLQAAMEMGLLVDFRENALSDSFKLLLTSEGQTLYKHLKSFFEQVDFSFDITGKTGELSWNMNCRNSIVNDLLSYLSSDETRMEEVRSIFFNMVALSLFLHYIYTLGKTRLTKSEIYQGFFEAPFVRKFLDQQGIERPTEEGAKHRVPFLINLLESIGIVKQSRSDIELLGFYINNKVLSVIDEFKDIDTHQIEKQIYLYYDKGEHSLSKKHIELLREVFGEKFLTAEYHLEKL
jgi:superfamily II DNA or RNA helicase